MANNNIRDLRYKTINKSGEAPVAGTTGHQKDTIFVKQITDTTFTPIVTDGNGKALELEKPQSGASTFRDILKEGNYIPIPISFLPKGGSANKDTATEGDEAGALGIDATTYTYHFGKFNPENKTGYYGVHMGYNALSKNTGQSNTAVGALSLENNVTGEFNTAYGFSAGNKLMSGTRNTLIGINSGKNAKLLNGVTLVGANAGAGLNYERIDLTDFTNITPVFTSYFNSTNSDYKSHYHNYQSSDNTIATSSMIYIGNSCGEYGPTRGVGAIVISNSPLSNWAYRNYNNIVIGDFFKFGRNTTLYNSLILGSFLNLTGSNDNIFALHMSKTEQTSVSNALLYGKFNERKLKINGTLTLNPANAPAVNNTFTKVVIANDNGDLTFLTLGQLKALLEGVTPEPLNT